MEGTAICNDNGTSNINKEPEYLISALPVDCLNRVLELTSPRDACRAAAACTAFHCVVESDDLWKHFLPTDLPLILSHADTDVHQQLPLKRKELYRYLCHNWIKLDGGLKSFSLDFSSGAKKILLHEGSLKIIMDSRVPTRRILLTRGTIDVKDLSPSTNYAAYLVFTGTLYSGAHDELRNNGEEEAEEEDIQLSTAFQFSRSVAKLVECLCTHGFIYRECSEGLWQESEMREDGRWEIKLGNFNTAFVRDGRSRVSVYFSDDKLRESDVIIQALEVRPQSDV